MQKDCQECTDRDSGLLPIVSQFLRDYFHGVRIVVESECTVRVGSALQMKKFLNDKEIIESWRKNVIPWGQAVRGRQIKSRRDCTDAAIFAEVVSRAPASVLDIGCGEGWLCRQLSKEGIDVVGIDAVSGLIDLARDAGNEDYRVVTYEEIIDGKLDIVVDIAVANFSLLGGPVVDELVRVSPRLLTPGGYLIIQTVHPALFEQKFGNADGWQEGSWEGCGQNFVDPAPWYFRTRATWHSLLESAGYEVRVVEPASPESERPSSIIFVCSIGG